MSFDAWRYFMRGRLLGALRLRAQALDAYRAALDADPGFVKAASYLGYLYGRQGRYAEAVAPLQRTVELRPERPDLWFNLGYVCDKAGRRQEALQAFAEALRLRPDMDLAWYGLGMTHAALGDHEAAASALEQAATLQPMNGHAWYALGMAHHRCHRPERVKEVIEHIVRFDPQSARRLIREAGRADLAHLVAHMESLRH